MTALADILAILVFCFVLLFFYGLRRLSGRKKKLEQSYRRLAQLTKLSPQAVSLEVDSIVNATTENRFKNLPFIGEVLHRLFVNLQMLGWYKNIQLRLLSFAMAGVLVGSLAVRQIENGFLLGVIVGAASAVGLFVALYLKALNKYIEELKISLPEAIDSITRTCRAGVPITSAFAMVGQHLSGPIADEFKVIDHWLRLGVPLRRAMQDSANRIILSEYRFFAVILIINQEAGGGLSETLTRLTQTLRDRHELQLKILSKTSEARASAKIVSALVPGIVGYMYFNSPDDFQFLMTDPVGKGVFLYAVCSVVIGLVITQVMVRRVG